MTRIHRIDDRGASLQEHSWPAFAAFVGHDTYVAKFLELSPAAQDSLLRDLRSSPDEHGRLIHTAIADVHAYLYGYADSPVFLRRDRRAETALSTSKLVLEDELLDAWIGVDPLPKSGPATDQVALARELRALARDNDALRHPLFDYLAVDADLEATREFLFNEVIRNEVVDDEVAQLTLGKQGTIKAACSLNHADEVGLHGGRAKSTQAHTYWLRELVEGIGLLEFQVFRAQRPWHMGITSNVFNTLLTRPGLRFAALGHFIATESWVDAHFEKVLEGMERHGLAQHGRYFRAHRAIDPAHTEELVEGIERQVPALSAKEVRSIYAGAQIAVKSAVLAYDWMLAHLRALEVRP